MVMDALGIAQEGCETVTVGAAGVAGCMFTVTEEAGLTQPCAFFEVTE